MKIIELTNKDFQIVRGKRQDNNKLMNSVLDDIFLQEFSFVIITDNYKNLKESGSVILTQVSGKD